MKDAGTNRQEIATVASLPRNDRDFREMREPTDREEQPLT